MNKIILASINNICEELEASGHYKAANQMTEVMIRLSQNSAPGIFERMQQQQDYYKATEAYKDARSTKEELDPETFFVVQEYDRALFKKKQIPKTMTPFEIGRFLAKTNVDVNKLKNELYGITNFSQTSAPASTSGSPQQALDTTTEANGKRVESGETEGMNDNQLIGGYVWLVAQNLQKHNLDKALDWNDKARENLSPEAYTKFGNIQEKLYDQYAEWEAEHPDQVEKRDRKLKTPEENDPFAKQSPGTSTATTPEVKSSGLDRWVNKAENIYKAWSDKNMPANSTAPLLIKDVLDYMIKVKNNLTSDKTSDAQAKIDKVQSFLDNIRDRKPHTGTVAAYSTMTGFGKKESDVFGGEKLDSKKLDYLAKQEAKSTK